MKQERPQSTGGRRVATVDRSDATQCGDAGHRHHTRRAVLGATGVVASTALAGCVTDLIPPVLGDPDVGEWPTIRGTDGNAAHVADGVEPPRALERRWRADPWDLGGSVPAVGTDRLFVGTGGRIAALDRYEGTVEWEVFEDDISYVTVAGGRLFAWVSVLYDELAGYRAQTGRVRWTVELDDVVVRAPVATRSAVYVMTTAGELLSLGARWGKERWRRSVGGGTTVPTVHDGIVYVPAPEGLLALEAASGEDRWTAPMPRRPAPGPAVADGRIVVGSDRLRVFDAASGDPLWDHPVPCQYPVAIDDVVYTYGSPPEDADTGVVIALDAETGAERWRTESRWRFDSALAVAHTDSRRVVYAVGESRLHVIDGTDGTILQEFPVSTPVVGPVVRGEWLYIGSAFGGIDAYGPAE